MNKRKLIKKSSEFVLKFIGAMFVLALMLLISGCVTTQKVQVAPVTMMPYSFPYWAMPHGSEFQPIEIKPATITEPIIPSLPTVTP